MTDEFKAGTNFQPRPALAVKCMAGFERPFYTSPINKPTISITQYKPLSLKRFNKIKYNDDNANAIIDPIITAVNGVPKIKLKIKTKPVYIPEHKKGLFVISSILSNAIRKIIFSISKSPL